MIRGLLGREIGMTQIFDKDGNVIPVTVVEAGPCKVLALSETATKTQRIKLGFDPVREKLVKKPELGYFKKLNVPALRFVKEVESTDNKDYQVGQDIKTDIFRPGDFVDVTGVSKGKGFAGGMKRWNWSGGDAGHGSMHHRRVGSIGSSSDPSRVYRGQHMPGHMGDAQVSVQGLRVMQVDLDNNLLLIKGAIPGGKRAYVLVKFSKKKIFQALDQKKAVTAKSRNPMKQSKGKVKGK
jgi:large subunit ribosomal protein L3